MSRHIIVELKTKDNEKILKTAREKSQYTSIYNRTMIQITGNAHQKPWQPEDNETSLKC